MNHHLVHTRSPGSSDRSSEYEGIHQDTESSSTGQSSVVPTRRPARSLDVATSDESQTVKVLRQLHAKDVKSRAKPKISDFSEEVTSTLHLACSYYRVFIATRNGFPLKLDQDQFSQEAWQLAVHENNTEFTATLDVYRVVRQYLN